jgi:hypothetical protein
VVALGRLRTAGVSFDLRPLVRRLTAAEPHYGRANPRRYRWGLSHLADAGSVAYRRPPDLPVRSWRPSEWDWYVRDPSRYGQRLMEPIVLAASLRFWGGVADDPAAEPEVGQFARSLLDEVVPTAEHDLAVWFAAIDPWRDTFALWLLSGEPQATKRLRDLIFSLAIRYGGIAAREGLVRGLRHPFFEVPLPSASAHLAAGLWRSGVYPSVVPALVAHLTSARHRSGAWADGDQPPDVLTTLAAGDTLARLDPSFDPEPVATWLCGQQEPAGWWRALDPEVPWLTSAVLDWLELASRPFPERFEWPQAPIWSRDRLSGLTTLATLDELAAATARLSPLAALPIEAAFIDLAGFGAWNTTHGQTRGDDLIGVLGRSLGAIPGVLAVRIGGDEFLVLGKPGAGGLAASLDAWRREWPSLLDAAGLPGETGPRVLVGHGLAGGLADLRRSLGDTIGQVKREHAIVPASGVLLERGSSR